MGSSFSRRDSGAAHQLSAAAFTRFQMPDIIVGLWIALSALFFLLSLEQQKPSRRVCWGFAATCALNGGGKWVFTNRELGQ